MSDELGFDPADRGDDRPGLEDAIDDLEATEDDELEDELEDDDGDDLDDDLEDATEDEIDFVITFYREDGVAVAAAMDFELANDLDELITELQRLPGDGGAAALVSVAGEFFVAVRVRGRHVQVVLSDVFAAENWPLARDVVDYLDLDVDDDELDGPVGDLAIFADQGLSEMDLTAICADEEEDSDVLALLIADHVRFGPHVRKVAKAFE